MGQHYCQYQRTLLKPLLSCNPLVLRSLDGSPLSSLFRFFQQKNCSDRDLNPKACIYYVLSILTKLNSRELLQKLLIKGNSIRAYETINTISIEIQILVCYIEEVQPFSLD